MNVVKFSFVCASNQKFYSSENLKLQLVERTPLFPTFCHTRKYSVWWCTRNKTDLATYINGSFSFLK